MARYEFLHPVRNFEFEARDDKEAQAMWYMGLFLQPDAAKITTLIRLSDGADITPSVPDESQAS